ncbi:hypothetical protein GM658_05455 [Pseudoduganella eburnea]|uniref:BON domain-containing protein n=1 Tax=Massilia eburnea TaxID=1776165 RepID=A0A6L6QD71_9BURK|nr:hypothetical protein [Massilia eburnea]MTW10041.1 hypothetical protein [Massilia eburnea]
MNLWLVLAICLFSLTSHAADLKRSDGELSCARANEVIGDREVDAAMKRNSKAQSPAISHPSPKKVTWQLAEKLILSGRIRTIVQSHDRSVLLLTSDGQGFIAKEPEIDRAINLSGEVDPCHVFIGVVTE